GSAASPISAQAARTSRRRRRISASRRSMTVCTGALLRSTGCVTSRPSRIRRTQSVRSLTHCGVRFPRVRRRRMNQAGHAPERNDSEEGRGSRPTSWDARRMATTQAVYYRDEQGLEPVDAFVAALPAKRAAKIDDYVEQHLNDRPPDAPPPGFPVTSQIDGELRELRVRFARTRYRVLYQRSGNLVVLLHAFEKDTGAVPPAETALAKRRMADFKR